MSCLGDAAGHRLSCAQGPALLQCRAITNLDRDPFAVLVHLHPKRIGLVETEGLPLGIERGEDNHRFARREHTTAHVALGSVMFPRSEYSLERLPPIFHRLAIHS